MSTAGLVPSGTLETLSFAQLLARFWDQGFTGSFRAQSEARPGFLVTKELLLERGKIAWAASDDEAESIRTFLLNKGTLNAEQWRLAEERAQGAQTRQVLLDLGFLTTRELQTADRERVTGIVLSLFGWRHGDYAVAQGNLPPRTPNLKIDPRDLVLEGLMASGDRDRVLEEIGSLDSVYIVRPDDLVRASLSLPVEMVDLMGRADGTRTVSDLCALSPLPDFLVSAALAALKVLGLARPADREATDAPPSPSLGHGSRKSSRHRKGRSTRHGPSHEEPMLPYDEPAGAPQAVPSAASRPAHDEEESSLPSREGPAAGEDSRDSEGGTTRSAAATRKVETPPGGVQTGRHAPADRPGKETSNSGKVVWANALVEQNEDPIWDVITPPKVRAARSAASRDEEEMRETHELPDIDGEDDALKPGIAVEASTSPIETPDDGLDDIEIEGVLERLSDSDQMRAADASRTEEEPVSESPVLAAGDGEDATTSPGLYASPPPEPARDESGDPFWQNADADETEGETTTEDSAPGWIYEPSGRIPSEGARQTSWIRWAGLTGLVLIASVSLILLLSGGAEADSRGTARDAAKSSGPPAIEPPSSFADQAAGPQVPVAQEASPSAERSTAPSPESISTASLGGNSAAGAGEKALASPGEGDIFHSAAFQLARSLMLQGKIQDAAGKFAAVWSGRKGLYTVQLALACESGTVRRAVGSARGSDEFFIMPKEYRGKSCYRLLWGSYPDRDAAFRGRSTVPDAFRTNRNRPFPAPI